MTTLIKPENVKAFIMMLLILAIYFSFLNEKAIRKSNKNLCNQIAEHTKQYAEVVRAQNNLAIKIDRYNELVAQSIKIEEKKAQNMQLMRQNLKDMVAAKDENIN